MATSSKKRKLKEENGHLVSIIGKVSAELDRVKKERDAAVQQLELVKKMCGPKLMTAIKLLAEASETLSGGAEDMPPESTITEDIRDPESAPANDRYSEAGYSGSRYLRDLYRPPPILPIEDRYTPSVASNHLADEEHSENGIEEEEEASDGEDDRDEYSD